MAKFAILVVLCTLTFFAVGCDQAPLLTESGSDTTSPDLALKSDTNFTAEQVLTYVIQKQAQGEALTLDEKFVALSKTLPGFGGFYVNEQGQFTVRLGSGQHLSDAQIQGGLAPVLDGAPALARASETGTLIKECDYSFADLYAWKLEAHALLDVPGLTGIDADEVRNRVRIAVEDEAAAARVREALQKLSIPSEAVFIETGQRVAQTVDLRDDFYLVEGGFEIGVPVGTCTLGFSAYLNGQLGFITNTHCTSTYGGVDGSQVYQDSYGNPSEYIGYETVDPPFYYYGSGSSPARGGGMFGPPDDGNRHRKSDAAFIRSVTTDVNLPVIARTESRSRTNGSRTRDGGFSINDEALSYEHVVGMELNKIGRTTGWTYGYIQSTCEDIKPFGQQDDRVLDCQYKVDAGADHGDSGSPVFAWSGSGEDVTLHGVLWGCSIAYPGGPCLQEFIYSPISGIESDLGALTTH